MKKNILTVVLSCILFSTAFAQQPSLNWMKHLGTSAEGFTGVSMEIDSGKAVIVAGLFRGTADFDDGPGVFNMTSNGDQDLFITEYDSAGNFHWAKHIGGLQGDQVREMKLDNQGNIILMGMYQGTVDMDPGPGTANVISLGSDAFVIKLDNNGNYIWSRQWQVYSINTMEVDANNNIILGGDFGGPADFDPGIGTFNMTAGNLYNDLFVCKIDAYGNFKWAKQMPNQSNASMQELSMESDSKGNIFMAGNFTQSLDFDPGSGVMVLNSNGDNDGFLVKLDSNGSFSWVKQFGAGGTDKAWSVSLDHLDQIILTGYYNGTVDFDPGPGVYYLTNTTNRGCFIVKLDANGSLIFAKSFQGEAFGESVEVDGQNYIYISGGFYNTVDFDPGPDDHSLTEGNIFITKLSSSGDYVWAVQFLNAILGGYESINCKVKIDALKNIYYTGLFPFAVDFDPSPGTYIVTPYGITDAPIVKLFSGNCQTPTENIITSVCDSFKLNGIAYYQSGSYTQSLTNSLGCDSIIAIQLTILPKPLPNLGKDSGICSNLTILLNPGVFNSYEWIDGSTIPTFNVSIPGTYWVSVTDNNGCRQNDTINIFSGTDCGQENCIIGEATKFYPNPVLNQWFIDKNVTDCPVYLNLYNALGQLLIKEYLLADGLNAISLKKLPSGVYYYILYSNGKIVKVGSIAKEIK